MTKNYPLTFEKSIAFGRRLENIIPGGAHTYSKGRDQFPLNAPNGITHGKGAYIYDQDGNQLIDWGMGLTSVSIGHAYDPVDDAVIEAIRSGINFSRPAALELDAAEALLNVIDVDGMVKFAKHGSTVTTAAVKLARAYNGRQIVACPIEHPFFSFDDWFIGTTPSDFGVAKGSHENTVKFKYGDIGEIYQLFKKCPNDIACIIMEPFKFEPPPSGYLHELKNICEKNGALLIFDEMVSGFKCSLGGGQKFLDIEPDLSTWGKGISNGYSCTALVGRPDIMRLGGIDESRVGERKTFLISTTHGAESTGLAAMIATINAFKKEDMVNQNQQSGSKLKLELLQIIEDLDLEKSMRLLGSDCLLALQIFGSGHEPDLQLHTLFVQEMIRMGVCFQGIFFPTISHTPEIIQHTLKAFQLSCEILRQAIDENSADKLLDGPPIKPVFRRFV